MSANKSQTYALLGILVANGITLYIALWQEWSVLQLLWPFWIQSVIIGWFARQRILKLDRFCTKGLHIDGRSVKPTVETQEKTARNFGLHYGFFHLGYFVFLLVFSLFADAQGYIEMQNADTGEVFPVHVGNVYLIDLLFYLGLTLSFWVSHSVSHKNNIRADLGNTPNLGALVFLPYARVVPMHLCIIIAIPFGGSDFIWFFILLKTGADMLMHIVEHRILQGKQASLNVSDSEK